MRPKLHFTAESGWINDPHGLTFHDGKYHLFHQYVPGSQEWAPNCHWGHAVGTDLLTWERRPVAIAPGDGDDGIWTGSLVVDDDGDARIFYTSVAQPEIGIGRIRVAMPTDKSWDVWDKGSVLIEAPDDVDLIAYRDPFVMREGVGWRAFVGAADSEGTAMALTYTSTDLTHWTYEGAAASRSSEQRTPVWMGSLWECPQFFEVDDQWVMVSSIWDDDVLHYAGYAVGTYADGRFDTDTWGRLSFGDSYYAPSFFRDRDGRPCLMFWMRGVHDTGEGWSSCLSLPYVLSVMDGRLVATLHPQVDTRRERPARDGDTTIDAAWEPRPGGDCLVLAFGDAENAAVTVGDNVVRLDRPGRKSAEMPWAGGPLRLIVDGPVIEISSRDGVLGGSVEVIDRILPVHGIFRAWNIS